MSPNKSKKEFSCAIGYCSVCDEHYTPGQQTCKCAQRLRDAAPDLLDALKAIVEIIDRDYGVDGYIIDLARSAIAKAEGKEDGK